MAFAFAWDILELSTARFQLERDRRKMPTNYQILIVDDQPRTRQSLQAMLAAGLPLKEIRQAANGREALTCLETYHPDLVLMDVWMPEMDGIEATSIIKARYPQVKIVLISIYSGYEHTAQAVGADAFIAKEKPLELISVIQNVLKN
jgi:CheY-like chemotaxis protein